jgi:ABC-type methionine transport system ATPase subunit
MGMTAADDVVVDFNLVQGEQRAVRWPKPVSFVLRRGALLLIKTKSEYSAPLFRMCLGFSEPSNGRVAVNGQSPAALGRNEVRDYRRGIGSLLDPDGLISNLTIRMNLIVPLVYANGLDFEEAATRTEQTLDVMHLTMWADQRPASLPAEVRQTAALARALSPRPALMLLENPIASLDHKETRRLLSLCRMQAETLLVATHRNDGILHEFADEVWQWDDDGFRTAA